MSDTDYKFIIVDAPREAIKRITLNRPEARNALSNELRAELFHALETGDLDPEVRIMIIRGSGKAFSAGYDLKSDTSQGLPFHTAGGLGGWPRHVVEGCFRIWDLAKPVIAQVHGYCLAGGMELAQSCDLIYAAENATIGYPVVRSISPPDNQFFPWVMGMRKSMELMLTGNSMTGIEAVEADFANQAFPESELEERVLDIAERASLIPSDLQQFNKRTVHRQMELMGMRSSIRAMTDSQALACYTDSSREWTSTMAAGLTKALSERDRKFGDYREKKRDT